jgi:hypothetical protein
MNAERAADLAALLRSGGSRFCINAVDQFLVATSGVPFALDENLDLGVGTTDI